MNELAQLLVEKGGAFGIIALLLLKVGEMIWGYFRNREKLTNDQLDQLKLAIKENTEALARSRSEMKKLKLDLRRCFFVLKRLTGESWPEIANEMKHFSDLEP